MNEFKSGFAPLIKEYLDFRKSTKVCGKQTYCCRLVLETFPFVQDFVSIPSPDVCFRYIFLRNKSPLTQLGKSVPYMVFNAYRQKLGLPKVPFHGLRRSVGSNLVTGDISVCSGFRQHTIP